jgi:hypothetical protein
MQAVSFDLPPLNGETIHQVIDQLIGVILGMGRQMSVFAGC